MSEHCMSINDDDSSSGDYVLWKDVLLCSALYQRRKRMDFEDCVLEEPEDTAMPLSRNDIGFEDQESAVAIDSSDYDAISWTNFDSLLIPNSNSYYPTNLFGTNQFDSMLNLNVSEASGGTGGLFPSNDISQIIMNWVERPMSEDEDLTHVISHICNDQPDYSSYNGYNGWQSGEHDSNVSSEENDDCQSMSSDNSDKSRMRKNCLRSNGACINKLIKDDTIDLKRSSRYLCDSDTGTSVSEHSRDRAVNSPIATRSGKRTVTVTVSPRTTQKVVKKSSTSNFNLRKYNNKMRNATLKSYHNDDQDDEVFSQSRPNLKGFIRVSQSSKRTSNITLDDNKSAVQARINREKKKAYISSLQERAADLEFENATMREETELARSDTEALVKELEYLKSVLANRSELSDFIVNLNNNKVLPLRQSSGLRGVRLSSSVKHDNGLTQEVDSSSFGSAVTAGVCLHVNQEQLTLEVCRHCAQKSNVHNS